MRPVASRCRRAIGGAGIEVDDVARFDAGPGRAVAPSVMLACGRDVVKVAGRWRYMFQVLDQQGQIVDV
jgi:hypothetical protein